MMQNRRHFTRNKPPKKATFVDNTPVPEGLVFYCKSCEKLIDLKPKTFDFRVPKELCGKGEGRETGAIDPDDDHDDRRRERGCEIVYGTERSIKQYYKIKDDRFDKERLEAEEKIKRAEKL